MVDLETTLAKIEYQSVHPDDQVKGENLEVELGKLADINKREGRGQTALAIKRLAEEQEFINSSARQAQKAILS